MRVPVGPSTVRTMKAVPSAVCTGTRHTVSTEGHCSSCTLWIIRFVSSHSCLRGHSVKVGSPSLMGGGLGEHLQGHSYRAMAYSAVTAPLLPGSKIPLPSTWGAPPLTRRRFISKSIPSESSLREGGNKEWRITAPRRHCHAQCKGQVALGPPRTAALEAATTTRSK